jgi:hypothetical protein
MRNTRKAGDYLNLDMAAKRHKKHKNKIVRVGLWLFKSN